MHKYFITAALLLVFGTSAYMSISGLAAVFAGGGLVVICMGAGMELGKLLSVVHLHRSWRRLELGPRLFFTAEILGYLTQRHSVAMRDLAAVETSLAALADEEQVLKAEMRVLDETLAGLPAAGPVIATARIMGLDEARAITVFIIFLVCVLEPLAIGLAVAASAAWTAPGKPQRSGMKRMRTAGETAKAADAPADPATGELAEICDQHGLTIEDLARITGRKQPQTVAGWWRPARPSNRGDAGLSHRGGAGLSYHRAAGHRDDRCPVRVNHRHYGRQEDGGRKQWYCPNAKKWPRGCTRPGWRLRKSEGSPRCRQSGARS